MQNQHLPIHEEADGKKIVAPARSRTFLDRCHEEAKRLGYTNRTVMEATGFTHSSTFYRFWNCDLPDPPIELDTALRLCDLLGLSLSEATGARQPNGDAKIELPISESSHTEVAENIAAIIERKRLEIEKLNAENKELTNDIQQLRALLESKNDELQKTRSEHMNQITAMYKEQIALHNQMHQLNREYAVEISKYAEQLRELTKAVMSQL